MAKAKTDKKNDFDLGAVSSQFQDILTTQLQDLVFIKDQEGKIVYGNDAYYTFFGPEQRDNIIGKDTLLTLDHDEAQAIRKQDKETFESGFSEGYNYVTDYTGAGRHLYTKKIRFKHEDGTPYILCIVRDISEAFETRTELEKNRQRYDLAIQGAGVGLWHWNIATDGLYCSPEFLNIIGIAKKNTIQTFSELKEHIKQTDLKNVQQAFDNHAQDRKPLDVEFRIKSADGCYNWVKMTGHAIWDNDGTAIQVAGSLEDITVRKKMQDALIESERRFQRAVDGARDGIWDWVDVDGDEQYWSPQLKKLLGYEEHEIQSSQSKFLEFMHPDDHDTIQAALQKHHFEDDPFDVEIRMRKKNGEYGWFQIRGTIQTAHAGEVRRMTGSLTDITKRKEAEENLEQAIDKLSNINEELERFAYVASHDLQEPLRMIVSFSSLLTKKFGSELNEEALEYVEIITDSAARMRDLVQDLLEHARIENDVDHNEAVDLNESMEYCYKILRETTRETKAEVTHDPLPTIRGNAMRISRVLQNLISNSLKYQQKGNKAKIHVSAEKKPEGFWTICVADNGIGIKQDYINQIFIPFKRLHSHTEFKGTGMGLSICKKVVESHGGGIHVTSEPGKGSKFYIVLPDYNTNDSEPLS